LAASETARRLIQDQPSAVAFSFPPEDVIALWAAVPYLEDLSQELVAALASAAAPREYAAGELIFDEGAPVAGLFMIEVGVVRITRFTKEGREHILHLLYRGDTFNDVAALDGGPNPASSVAHVDSVVWHISRSELRRIADQHPDLAWALVESIARRARYLLGLVQDLSMRNVRSRLANLLLTQARDTEREEVPRLLTQEEMASRLGTVREVVGRALRGLAADGIIEFDRHCIVILQPERLAEEADV
jgi:CRP-like cAMP-binding protein